MKKITRLKPTESSEEFRQRSSEMADELAANFYVELGEVNLHRADLLRVIAMLLNWELEWADYDSLPRHGFGSTEVWKEFIDLLETERNRPPPMFSLVK